MNILTELSYIGLSCATLILWDLMDFYVDLRQVDFLRTKPFWIHYVIRIFFSIAIMEILFTLNLLNITNKFIIAFFTPLLFPIFLQNLVVEIGGGGINIRDIFSQFRDAVVDDMQSRLISKKVRIQTKLLDSSLSNEYLKRQCLFLSPSSEEFDALEGYLNKKDENEARMEYVRAITRWGGSKHVKDLLKDQE